MPRTIGHLFVNIKLVSLNSDYFDNDTTEKALYESSDLQRIIQ